MKIKKYKKLKNGKYQVTLDNSEVFDIYEEVILNLGLLLKKDISNELKDKILLENEKYDAYYLSLKYLKTRVRSKKEIRDYLINQNYSIDNIESTLNLLEKQGYINELSFAKAFLNNKLITTSSGPNRIRNELRKKGIGDSIIEDTLQNYKEDIQREKIDKQANRIIKTNKNKGNRLLLSKIYNELMLEGFNKGLIREYLQGVVLEDEEELMRKEYNKLHKRLSRKYQGRELELKIKQKLYEKGFSIFY